MAVQQQQQQEETTTTATTTCGGAASASSSSSLSVQNNSDHSHPNHHRLETQQPAQQQQEQEQQARENSFVSDYDSCTTAPPLQQQQQQQQAQPIRIQLKKKTRSSSNSRSRSRGSSSTTSTMTGSVRKKRKLGQQQQQNEQQQPTIRKNTASATSASSSSSSSSSEEEEEDDNKNNATTPRHPQQQQQQQTSMVTRERREFQEENYSPRHHRATTTNDNINNKSDRDHNEELSTGEEKRKGDDKEESTTNNSSNSNSKHASSSSGGGNPSSTGGSGGGGGSSAGNNSGSGSSNNNSNNSSGNNNNNNNASHSPSHSNILQQPDGWRVKLYRLNADGSWDDCGTGRIVCLYRQQSHQQQQQQQHSAGASKTSSNNNSNSDDNDNNKAAASADAEANSGGKMIKSEQPSKDDNNINNNSGGGEEKATTNTDEKERKSGEPKRDENDSRDTSKSSEWQKEGSADDAASAGTIETKGSSTGGAPVQQQQQQQPQHISLPTSPANLDQWLYQETGEATLCVHAEVTKQSQNRQQPRVLLRTRILLRDAYQRQGDNIITWCEPYYGGNHAAAAAAAGANNDAQQQLAAAAAAGGAAGGGVDLALSFQDNAGCLDIWRQITHVQSRAAELLRQLPDHFTMLHGSLQQQQQQHHHHHHHHGAGGAMGMNGNNNINMNNSGNNNMNNKGDGAMGCSSVEDMAAQVAAQHHADLQRQQQHELWAHLGGGGGGGSGVGGVSHDDSELGDLAYGGVGGVGTLMDAAAVATQQSLPNPPSLQNLEEIADTIAALQHIQQRESLAMWIAKDECAYLKALLGLFPAAEARGDYGKLATLAACVKTILLLNDPSILELIVSVAGIFEDVCSCLEYDPDLREKANHRWFLRERAKFRTVVPMEDPDLISAIHRSFRVNYLRDTLLRPTMDESSLSTLSSLQTFTHADIVKGVTVSANRKDASLKDSYLVRVIRLLGVELHALSVMEWSELENQPRESAANAAAERQVHDELRTDPSIVVGEHSLGTTTWKQYLAPQDGSMSSRKLRRRGCLSFLRELFNMVRISLQQSDKDDVFAVICSLDIDLNEDREISDNVSQTSQTVEVGSVASTAKSDRLDEKSEAQHGVEPPASASPVNLLSLLGTILSDPNTDVSEKGCALEIIAGAAMHDPSLIRRHCLDFHALWKKNRQTPGSSSSSGSSGGHGGVSGRPEPNEKKQVMFLCPPNDLLASLIFLLDVATDAGILLQVTEIMRIILDTDMMGDHGPMNVGFTDEAEGIPLGSGQGPPYDQHNQPCGSGITSTDQKQFLSMFYEHYMEWLVAPFQFTILHPIRRVPDHILRNYAESSLMQKMITSFQKGVTANDPFLRLVPTCAIRASFAVELLSFCVRAHLYRMKFFLLKSRVLGNVLKLLRPQAISRGVSGDRCLKLAALRFLRSILSVNDEFYHRHIIQNNLFAPVFEAFRANPVGDNLVSSAIVEMCDYIHSENIKSLLEYIVTKHMLSDATTSPESTVPSLEDVSSPYVTTLTVLRKAYEANVNANKKMEADDTSPGETSPGGSRYFPGGAQHQHHPPRLLSGKALEDQRKFREVDEEESYFDSDEDGGGGGGRSTAAAVRPSPPTPPPLSGVVDTEVTTEQQGIMEAGELHRTPRMFTLAQQQQQQQQQQASVLNHLQQQQDEGAATIPEGNEMMNEDDSGRMVPEPLDTGR